jgi:CysZ protein
LTLPARPSGAPWRANGSPVRPESITRQPFGRTPGFWQGLRALPDGLRFVMRERKCWGPTVVPCGVVILLAVPLLWFAIGELGPWLAHWLLPDASTWYAAGTRFLVRWLSSAIAAYLALWVAVLSAPALSSPALEYLVRLREADLGVPDRPRLGFWLELRCALEAQLGAIALCVPLWFAGWVAGLIFPGALLLLPLQIAPAALGLAWNLLDYPLTLRGVRLRQRWQLLRRHPRPVFGFAACLGAIACIPGAALLLLPAGVVGAAQLSWQLLPEDTSEPRAKLDAAR